MTAANAASAGSDNEQVADDDTDADDLDDLMFELKECKTVADVLEVVTDEAASMSPEEVSFALYRLAYMARSLSNQEKKEVLDGDPVKALMSVVLQKHSEMNPAQACKCMWAMATLKADHNRPVVAALSQRWRTELVQQAPVLDNTQFLWALGTLGSRSNDRVYAECLNDLLIHIRRQISVSIRDGDDIDRCVSMAATGASKLRFRLLDKATDPAARGAFIVQLQRYLQTNIDAVGGRTLANTVRALVDLNSAPPDLLLATAEQMRKRPADFSLQERCMVIGACAAQRFHPGDIVGNTANRALEEKGLSSGSAGQLLLALARYGSAPPRSVIGLVEAVCPLPADPADPDGATPPPPGARPPSLDALVNATWAAGVLKVADAPPVMHLCEVTAGALDAAAAAGGDLAAIPERILRKAFHAQMLLRHHGGDLPLSQGVAAAAATEWAATLWPQGHSELVQSRLVRFLDAMRVPFKANVPVADGLLRIDVQLEQSNGVGPAAVMLSGAKDYLTGPGVSGDWTPCGPKAREEDMLAAAGFRPVRVPVSPVRHVPNMQFILYAEKLLKRAGVHKPDIPCSGFEAVMEVERMAQLAKRARQRSKDRPRGHQPGAVELRDHYAALPDEEDVRPLSTRTSPRRGRNGEVAVPAPQAGAVEVLAEDRHAFEAGIDSGSDSDEGVSDEEGRDGAGGVPQARGAADGGAEARSRAPRAGAWEDLALDGDTEMEARTVHGGVEMAGVAATAVTTAAAVGAVAGGRRVVTASRERRPAAPAAAGDSWGAVSGDGQRRPRGYGGYGSGGGSDILAGSGRGRGPRAGRGGRGGTQQQQRQQRPVDGEGGDDDIWSAAWQDEESPASRGGRGGRGGRGNSRGGRAYGRGAGRGQAW